MERRKLRLGYRGPLCACAPATVYIETEFSVGTYKRQEIGKIDNLADHHGQTCNIQALHQN